MESNLVITLNRIEENFIYKKAILVERVLSVLSIEYPINKKEYYDDMVTHLSKSFKGAVEGL